MNNPAIPALTPRLIVPRSATAIEFYAAVFGARELEHYRDPSTDQTVHAAISIGGAIVAMADESESSRNVAPGSLGGSAVLLHLEVDDPDAVVDRAVRRGAEVVFPVADQFYGRREGRIVDPFGHLWIVGTQIEELSPAEIARRVAGAHAPRG